MTESNNEPRDLGGRPHLTPSEREVEEVRELVEPSMFEHIPAWVNYSPRKLSKIDILHVAMAYATTGSLSKARKVVGMGYEQAKWCQKQEWWEPILTVCRKAIASSVEKKFSNLMLIAFEKLQDRLIKGDPVFTGGRGTRLHRKPVSASTINQILKDMFAQRQLLLGEVTSRSETVSKTDSLEDIKKVAEDFAKQRAKSG